MLNPNCRFWVSSGLFAECVSVSFHFCQVREVLEMKFYSLELPLISYCQNMWRHPQESLVHLYQGLRTQCFVDSGEWVSSAHLQLVDLPQLLKNRKATLILSKAGFTCSYSQISLTPSRLCVHSQGEAYTQQSGQDHLGWHSGWGTLGIKFSLSLLGPPRSVMVSWFFGGSSCIFFRITMG